MSTSTYISQQNIRVTAKLRTLRDAMKDETIYSLRSLVNDVLGLNLKGRTKEFYKAVICEYYTETNYNYTPSLYSRNDFKHSTFFYTRKNLRAYLPALPRRF